MKNIFGIIIAFLVIRNHVFAAEAGMPQLDSKYWASQAFWLVLVFSLLHLAISKLFIPKIKNSLDNRDNKIKNDLDNAKNLKDDSEKKLKEYKEAIENAKKDVQKNFLENKNKLNLDIQNKKKIFDKDLEKEIEKAQEEIISLKDNSITHIEKIAEEITSEIIKDISGDNLNGSSIKAAVSENIKNNLGKYS
jgi:F-type H+-transporting ATPase subunit b